MEDDGIGSFVVKELEKMYRNRDDILCIDGGTQGLELMPYFEGMDRCVIIDSIASSMPPGSIGVLRDDEIMKMLKQKMSVHEIGLVDLLGALELLDRLPQEVVLVGMVPYSVRFSYGLTSEAKARMPYLIETVCKEVENGVATG